MDKIRIAEPCHQNLDYTASTTQLLTVVNYEVSVLIRGKKRYELSNHLGNVMAVVQDRKRAINNTVGNPNVEYYIPYIVETHDYYAYGSLMEGRGFSTESYRFGFNGYEREDEVAGQGSVIDFGARIYDSRLCRFFSLDPIFFAHWSPYQYDGNNPIWIKDINGEGPGDSTGLGSASCKEEGACGTVRSDYYLIDYEVKVENGRKYWAIEKHYLYEDKVKELPSSAQNDVRLRYSTLTDFIKVGMATPVDFMCRLENAFNDEWIQSYSVPLSDPTIYSLIGSLLSPFDEEANYYFPVDNDGYIHLDNYSINYEAGYGGVIKIIGKGKPMWKLIRTGQIFGKNGSRFQIAMSAYWKQGYYKNGSVVDQFVHEYNTIGSLKHLDKLKTMQIFYKRLLKGGEEITKTYGILTRFQKEILIRELVKSNQALRLLK